MNNNKGGNPPQTGRPVAYQPVQQPAGQQMRPVQQQGYRAGQPVYAPVVYQRPPKKTPEYAIAASKATGSMSMGLLVLLSVIFGWFCSRSIFMFRLGLGMTAMGLLFYLIYTPFFFRRKENRLSLPGLLLFIPQIMILASFGLFSSGSVRFVAFFASLIIVMYQTTMLSGATSGAPFDGALTGDSFMNYIAYPFMNIGAVFTALFSGKGRSGKKNGAMGKIAIGLAISIPVVFILIMIFAFADKMFEQLVRNVISALNINPFRVAADILFTVITMMYVIPLVVTLRGGYRREHAHKASKRIFDPIIAATVLFAAGLIYVVFVGVQFTYLFAGAGSLPNGLTPAEYSRRGFIELVFVIVVTTVVIALFCMLTRHNEKGGIPAYTKAALLLITACNFVIIVSAVRRLIIYVDNFNMTVTRFNAAVLIALMTVITVVVALRIIFEKLKVSAVVGSILIATAALYCIFNVEGFVARYNVDRYLENPTSSRVDVYYLARLSPAVVPQLERLMNEAPSEAVRLQSKYAIANVAYWYDLFDGDARRMARWTLDRQRAVDIMDKYGIEYDMEYDYFSRFEVPYRQGLL